MSSNHRSPIFRSGFFSASTWSHAIVDLVVLFLLSTADFAAAQDSRRDPREQGDPYNYGRLSPAMAVIVVILIAALFLMGFFSIYIRHCTSSRGDASVRPFATVANRVANLRSRGLEASVIETFPRFVYSEVKDQKLGKGALECAVCLCEFEDDETLRLLPKCDHVFHADCIDAWLESHVTCPVCRTNLAESPPDPGQPAPDTHAAEGETTTDSVVVQVAPEPPRLLDLGGSLNRNRARGSRSSRARVKFPRSHSTGHSLVQPGEDTERFTLRLPAELRKQIVANQRLSRATSLVVLPREGSSRRGKRLDWQPTKSDRWAFLRNPSVLWRNASTKPQKSAGEGPSGQSAGAECQNGDSVRSGRWMFLRNPSFLRRAASVKSPKAAGNDGEGSSVQSAGTGFQTGDLTRPPV